MVSVKHTAIVMSFLDQMTFSMTIVILGQYLISMGASQFFIGGLNSLFAFVGLLWSPIIGSLSDTKGRTAMLRVSIAFCIISNLVFYCTNSLFFAVIGRIFAGLGFQNIPLMRGLMSDVLPKEEQSTFFNKLQALGGVAFMVGSMFSGFLSETENGIHRVFGLITIIFCFVLGLSYLLPDTKPIQKPDENNKNTTQNGSKKEPKTGGLSGIIDNIKNVNYNKFWDLFAIRFFAFMTIMSFHSNVGPMAVGTFQLKGRLMAILFVFISIVSILTNLAMIRLKKGIYAQDKYGYKRLFHGGFVLIFTSLALICSSITSSLLIFIISVAPLATSRIFFDSTIAEAVLAKADPDEKGKVSGVIESITSFAGLIMPLIAGYIVDQYGTTTSLSICLLPAVGALLVAYSQRHVKEEIKQD